MRPSLPPQDKLDGEVIRKAVERRLSQRIFSRKHVCTRSITIMETDAAITGIITMRSVAITVIMKADAVMDITMTMRTSPCG